MPTRLANTTLEECWMTPRKPGCLQCRKRHVRCDSVKPSCSTCLKAKDGRQCSYVSLDIRPSKYTRHIGRQTLGSPTTRLLPSCSPRAVRASPLSEGGRDARRHLSPPDVGSEFVVKNHLEDEWPNVKGPDGKVSKPRGRQAAVVDPLEAELFEYYIKHTGYYLDIVSPDHHLSRAAPILALSDPLLYSACMAYSSHVLYLLGRLDRATEQRFNDYAIQLLIQKLSEDPATWSEGSVLTTTVLMRVTEQFSEIADDGEYHLNGAFSITAAAGRTWELAPVDLETSAFWTYLRMSVRMCFLCEHATKCDPVALVRIRSSKSTSATLLVEAALTNRMTYLMANICNACWPASRRVDEADLVKLKAELEDVGTSLPPVFQPWSSISQPGSRYPIVKHIDTWHIIFWQFFYAAQVLLAANFALISPSPTVASQGQYLEREIVGPSRKLLAVAFSNDEIGLRINAAALVAWCGQYLTNAEEQQAVVDWLSKLAADAAWPHRTVLGRLRRIWAGEQSHWTADPVL